MEQHSRIGLEMEQGVTIRFSDQVLTGPGRTQTQPRDFKDVGPILRELPIPSGWKGTHNLPISTAQFPSNWELSVHRATNVIRYLIEEQA